MKLNLNAKELLALHNQLHHLVADRLETGDLSPDVVQLKQVYNRLRAVVVAALMGKVEDPVDAFLAHEQAKIDRLDANLNLIKQEQNELPGTVGVQDFDDGNDREVLDYPSRSRAMPNHRRTPRV
jgi:hypothetical protein